MATPKKPTPKVKITGSATTKPGTRLGIKSTRASITKGTAIGASPKVVDKKGKVSAALKDKVTKAQAASRAARGNLMVVKEARKLGNLQGPGVAAKITKEANQRNLDTGRTAARGKMQTNNALRPKKNTK